MKQFWTVFKFEFKNYAKNKAFIILTLLLVVGVGVVLSIPRIQAAIGSKNEQSAPTEKTVIALADKTGTDANAAAAFFTSAMKDTEFKVTDKSVDELKKAVDNDEYNSAIVLNSNLNYTHIVKNVGMYNSFDTQFNEILLAKYRSDTLSKSNLYSILFILS